MLYHYTCSNDGKTKIPVESLTQESEGIVEVDKGVITYKKLFTVQK